MPGNTHKQPADLLRMFKEANRKSFDGKLPVPRLMWSDFLPRKMAAGCHLHGITTCKYTGGANCKGDAIVIRPWLRKFSALAYGCLVHEMCHLSYRVSGDEGMLIHAAEFVERMREIVAAGGLDDTL